MTQVNTISPSQWNTLVDNHGWAAAETMLKEANCRVADADVKTAIANSTKEDTVTLSKQLDKLFGIKKNAKSKPHVHVAFDEAGVVKRGGELTKKGKAAMTAHKNTQAAIDGAKAYAEREAARQARWAEGAAARAEHLKALKERIKNGLNKVIKTPADAAADAAETAGRTTAQGMQEAVETAGRTTTQGMQEAVETAAETASRNPLFKKIAIGALAAAAVIGTIFAVTNKKDNAEVKEAA